jgi:malate dehydrogenase (oxaloacetate-decarboxylating)
MASPNASNSVTIRAEIENKPGTLGRITTAIGKAGGNIQALDIVEATPDLLVRDITVMAVDDEHVEKIRKALEKIDGIQVVSVQDRTLRMHEGGKIEVVSKIPLQNRDDLSMAYTPGVARVCVDIAENPSDVHRYTIKKNTVAIVTDGTAVLGLGNIGPSAGLPVMEGKALLFKEFAGVDAFPICLDIPLGENHVEEVVKAVQQIEPVFGGINLEDIAAPDCFEIEKRLQETLEVPVFHDDQHGTAVVVLAALRNALKVVGKNPESIKVVISGVGAAGVAITKILLNAGVKNVVGVDRKGAVYSGRPDLDNSKQWFAENTNPENLQGSMQNVIEGADVFIGVSGPGVLKREDVQKMAKDPVVFAMANPTPEITPEEAEGVVAVMATGRSDYANQINNVLCFPGIFRGALDAGATKITENMKVAAANAIASSVPADELSAGYIVPSVFNKNVVVLVAEAVAEAARADGVVRK